MPLVRRRRADRRDGCRRPAYNPTAEREQQENSLRQRPAPPPSLDDVVRFLRQLGDIVVRNGDHYSVNYSLSLTAQELVMRANRTRAAKGKPPFEVHAALPADAIDAADRLFKRAFAGDASAEEARSLARAYGCRLIVVMPSDGAWQRDVFAGSGGYRLVGEKPGGWRIYRAAD